MLDHAPAMPTAIRSARYWGRFAVRVSTMAVIWAAIGVEAQTAAQPYAALLPATAVTFPSETDSNSPAVWELMDGQWVFSLFNSVNGQPVLSRGPDLTKLTRGSRPRFHGVPPEGGVWFESVIRDADSWYGFYHNERIIEGCGAPSKVLPRIGMARSEDFGATWVDLGPIIEAPTDAIRCTTRNFYFVGGVGDLSVMLDPDRLFAYIYYSQYLEAEGRMGVVVARLAWGDRDAPAGRVDVWSDGVWTPPTERKLTIEDDVFRDEDTDPEPTVAGGWEFPAASPFFASVNRWDDAAPGVDVFWGPSIHWNTAIQSYVMLLNRATGDKFDPGGIYVSFADRLDEPGAWSVPQLLLRGGAWYPQVIGLDPTVGSDTLAGGVARFFMSGTSTHLIVFGRR